MGVISVVVAAHNEQRVIGQCLAAMRGPEETSELEITVVANGCNDRTADLAREAPGVTVIELANPGKANALNAGDAVSVSFPRLYLDADMRLSSSQIRRLAAGLRESPAAQVCVPRRRVVVEGRPIAVRAYFAIQCRLPVYESGLFGRGAIMISQAGRARFVDFPDETGDDLFLDSLFRADERVVATTVTVDIDAPRATRELMRRLIRVRRGNNQLRSALLNQLLTPGATAAVRRSDTWAWLHDVELREPRLVPAATIYVALTVAAEFQARRTRHRRSWGRTESTRALG